MSDTLLQQSAGVLLDLARRALASAVSNGRGSPPGDIPRTSPLDEPSGVFVTLRGGDRLRGCIGLPYPDLPMAEAAWQAAQQAALEDPRFPPVTEEELPDLTVEISILTPHEPLGWIEEFELGRDGAVLEVAGRRSLYLPGVATETGWSIDEFFDHLAMKAGLPAEAWRLPEAQIWRFRTVTAEGAAVPNAEA
jgi:AmmeMemoRadiSam system protein A